MVLWKRTVVLIGLLWGFGVTSALGQVTVNIGTLPAGKSVTVVFNAQINSPLPPGTTQISQQGTLTGANFSPVLSDDPTTPAAHDPTITQIGAATDGGGGGGPSFQG